MEKEDGRKLTSEAQEQLRKQAIRLMKQGKKNVEIAAIIGAHRNSVSQWRKNYARDGAKGLASKKRGIAKGQNRTLTISQEDEIQNLLIDKTPDQFKLVFALWTRQAVQELIKMRLGIDMPIRTVGEYLLGVYPAKAVETSL
jgi:transposase